MKKLILSVLLNLMLTAGAVHAADVEVQTGSHIDWWEDNRRGEARQAYFPIRITGSYRDFSATILTAYADTHLNTPQEKASLSDFLDTRLITSYAMTKKLPVDMLLGLDLNLPTGRTNLSTRQLSLIMDPDLVSINNYGEGFDVNPTVTMARQWGRWLTGLGLGYLWRGSYDLSSEAGLTDYDPGEVYTVTGELRYYFSPAAHARIFARHAWFTADTLKGEKVYQEGEFTLVGIGLQQSGVNWLGEATFRSIFRDKSKFQQASGGFALESYDFQGDEYILDLDGRYFFDERTSVKGAIHGRYFTNNDYPSDSPFYVGARRKISLDIGLVRNLTRQVELAIDVIPFLKFDDRQNFPIERPSREFTGISANLALTGSF